MTFQKDVVEYKELIDSHLSSILKYDDSHKTIIDSMNYSLLAGGKRVRPTLTLAITKALGGDVLSALPFAISIECIHTYSLIHDDLPAMDNDDLRRGMPTNHIKFGEANAILAGDGLLNLAYEIIFNKIKDLNNIKYIEIGNVISRAAGTRGMILGQVIDMESENQKIPLDTLIKMHENKTGALIEASCIVGALISNREDLVSKISEYGKNIGLVFQIVDDVLDYTSDSKSLGKRALSDKENNKSTFVTLLGIEESLSLANDLTNEALVISKEIDKSGFLTYYTEYLLNRKS
ncbi:MAG: polyprenyl synthetase family protein [Clostridium sp.]